MSETKTVDVYLYLGVSWPWEGKIIASNYDYSDDPAYVFLHKLEAVEVRVPTHEQINLAKIANLEKENRKLQAETQKKIDENNETIKSLQALEYKP